MKRKYKKNYVREFRNEVAFQHLKEVSPRIKSCLEKELAFLENVRVNFEEAPCFYFTFAPRDIRGKDYKKELADNADQIMIIVGDIAEQYGVECEFVIDPNRTMNKKDPREYDGLHRGRYQLWLPRTQDTHKIFLPFKK